MLLSILMDKNKAPQFLASGNHGWTAEQHVENVTLFCNIPVLFSLQAKYPNRMFYWYVISSYVAYSLGFVPRYQGIELVYLVL